MVVHRRHDLPEMMLYDNGWVIREENSFDNAERLYCGINGGKISRVRTFSVI